ncbi:MAG: fibronectin type III domain-containing protein, partial [Bdellovibrionales bacterium]|nr:fibronectin type III domain-containing protein [Bdellovibrionales bacterium]
MRFSQTYLVVRKSVVVMTSLLTILSLAACPKDVSLPTDTASTGSTPGYAGFTGAVTASTVGPTKVKLTWSPSTDPKVVAYNIYDATLFFAPRLIRTVTGEAAEVTLNGLTAQTYYKFRVRAADKDMVEVGNTNDLP